MKTPKDRQEECARAKKYIEEDALGLAKCFARSVFNHKTKLKTKLKILPSKSSMLFSNLVTDLSANSARVSACNDSIYFSQNCEVLHLEELQIQGKLENQNQAQRP